MSIFMRLNVSMFALVAIVSFSACDYTPRDPGWVCNEAYCGPTKGGQIPFVRKGDSSVSPAQVDDFAAWVAGRYSVSEASAKTLIELHLGVNRDSHLAELGLSEAEAQALDKCDGSAPGALAAPLSAGLGEKAEAVAALLSAYCTSQSR